MEIGESIESPVMGLRVTWREVADDVVAVDLHMRAEAPAIPMHVHPRQEERVAVLSGKVRSRSGDRDVVLGPGETVTTPPGEPHTIEATGGQDAEVRAELRPALGYVDFIERGFAQDRAGHVRPNGQMNPLRMATTGPAQAEFFLAGPPIAVQKALLHLFAFAGRALGYGVTRSAGRPG